MDKKLDLIDRNELYNQIRLHLNRHSLGETAPWTTLTTGEIASIIANMPMVEAEEIRYGKWIDLGDGVWQCTVCGDEFYFKVGTPIMNNGNYCPCCGAKMEGSSDA